MQASPFYSHHGHLARQHRPRLSWPVLAGVLGVHALLLAWMLLAHAPSSPTITPPMMGILLSDAASAGERPSASAAASQAGAPPSTGKTEKRPDRPVTQHPPAKNAEKTAAASTANAASHTAAAQGATNDTAKAGNTGTAGGAADSGAGGGTGTFFSPRVDAPGAYNPKPRYPAASRRMGEEGMVTLSVHVLATGEVADVRLKKSSGYSRLDNAATEAVKKWRYLPARQGNTPVSCWYTQAVKFSLTD